MASAKQNVRAASPQDKLEIFFSSRVVLSTKYLSGGAIFEFPRPSNSFQRVANTPSTLQISYFQPKLKLKLPVYHSLKQDQDDRVQSVVRT